MRGEKKAQTANTVSWSQTKHSGFKERYLKSHLILYSWKYWLWLCVVRSTETSNSAENVIWKVKSDQILDHYLSTPYQSLLLRFYHKASNRVNFQKHPNFPSSDNFKSKIFESQWKWIWIVFPLTTAIPIFVKSPTMLCFAFFALIETCLCVLPK